MTSGSGAGSRRSWLHKWNITELEEEGVIVAQIGGVASSEDEDLVLSHFAGGVIGTRHGRISGALLQCPLHGGVVDDPDGIEVVLGEQLGGIGQHFGFFESPEHVVHLAESDDGMSGNRGRYGTRLFDLLPRNRRRLC